MGTVWRAEQQQPVRREVALKVIKPGLGSAGIIARFEAEQQALALMDHPHIAKVLDAGETPPAYAGGSPRPYFAMELVPGVPITQFCDERRLSLRQRLELLIPVCQAVQHAHQKGIIHRDFKPSNVLVALYDGQALAKVIDFGIAKATGAQLTEQTLHTTFGTVVGTLEYMAPEQAELNAFDIDTRADIYSLGVLLYELLTGSTPRRGRLKEVGLLEVLRLIREQEPERPSARLSSAETPPSVAAARATESTKLAKQVQGDLDWIVLKCLDKDRKRRYETANGLARDLQRYLADEPVAAGPPGAGYRLRKFVRRHQGPVLAAALVLLTLVGGIAGTTWGLVRAEWARLAEAKQRGLAEEREQVAEAKEQEALRQKQIAEAVQRYLTHDLLGEAAPAKNPWAKQVTVEEVLKRAAQKIDQAFVNQPAVEAAVRTAVGVTYHELGLFPEAEPHLRRALALCQELYGPEHAETLTAVNNLAMVLYARANLDEAETLLRQNLEARRRVLGADHRDTLQALNNLAVLLQERGQLAEAEGLYHQSLDAHQRLYGPDHLGTLSVLNNLAGLLEHRGKLDEAEPLFRLALEGLRRVRGPFHPETLVAVNNLAMVLKGRGQLDEAERLLRQNLEDHRRILGPEHPDALQAVNSLAFLLQARGKLDEAEPLLKQNLEARQRVLGADHPSTLQAGHNLAELLLARGQVTEAEKLFRQNVEAWQRVRGPEHPETLQAVNSLASLLRSRGERAEAVRLFRQNLEALRQTLGPDHPYTLGAMNNLALVLQEGGQLAEAEPLFREALDRRRQVMGRGHLQTADSLLGLGTVLRDTGRAAEAVPLLTEALTIRQQSLPSGDKRTAVTAIHLGQCFSVLRRYADAEPLLLRGYETLKATPGIPPAELKRTLEHLVKLYEAWGKPEPADIWRKRLSEQAGPSSP